MNVLYQSAFLKALGWSLLDSFWQVGVLWLLYVVLTRNGRKFRSGQKHSLALFSLGGGALWFLITLVSHFYRLVAEGSSLITNTATSSVSSTSDASFTSLYFLMSRLSPFFR